MLGSALSHLGDGKELLEACFGALVRAAGVHDQQPRPNDKYGFQNRALALGELDEHLIPSGAAEIRRVLVEEEKQRGESFEPEQRDAAVRRISNQLYFSAERREFFLKIREKIELLRTIVNAAEKAEQGNFRFAEVKGVLCGLEMFFSDSFFGTAL